MAPGTINWDSAEAWQRVVAAIIASGVKLDLKSIATHYGCTYDTIEGRFRKIKKEAAVLRGEVEGDGGDGVTPARKSTVSTPRKSKAPKKEALGSVAAGRVTKKTLKKKAVKGEPSEDDTLTPFEALTDGDIDESAAGNTKAGGTNFFQEAMMDFEG